MIITFTSILISQKSQILRFLDTGDKSQHVIFQYSHLRTHFFFPLGKVQTPLCSGQDCLCKISCLLNFLATTLACLTIDASPAVLMLPLNSVIWFMSSFPLSVCPCFLFLPCPAHFHFRAQPTSFLTSFGPVLPYDMHSSITGNVPHCFVIIHIDIYFPEDGDS